MNAEPTGVSLDPGSLHSVARQFLDEELKKFMLSPAEGSTDERSATHVYRGGDRFISFRVDASPARGTVTLGVGSVDTPVSDINSVTLHHLAELTFASADRGRYDLHEVSVQEFAEKALKDLVDFAHEFLYGDIRNFIRILAVSNREKHRQEEAAVLSDKHRST